MSEKIFLAAQRADRSHAFCLLILLGLGLPTLLPMNVAASEEAMSGGEASVGLLSFSDSVSDFELTYKIRLAGLPVGISAKISATRNNAIWSAESRVSHFLARNTHVSRFSVRACEHRLLSFTNSGESFGWKFSDAVMFDWPAKSATYEGFTQSSENDLVENIEIVYPLNYDHYVDKLSQYALMGCLLEKGLSTFQLTYLDDGIGRYEFRIQATKQARWNKQDWKVVVLRGVPFEQKAGSVHTGIEYTLAPALHYLPIEVRTKLRGLPVTARLASARLNE